MEAKTPVIDAWIQHPTPGMLRHRMFDSLRRWMRMTEVPDEIPLSITRSAMEAAGVKAALICAWVGPDGPMVDNDQVAAFIKACEGGPVRLHGLASVYLFRPMEAVRELRRAVKTLGFVGLRMIPWLWGLPPNDRRYYPLYAECVELQVPFCLQVGHAGPLRPSEPGRPIPYLDEVACDFPELTIVAGHIGYPWTAEMVSMVRKYENVYIDTSAYKPSRFPQELVELMQGRGRSKVLFGSNHPMIFPKACLDEVHLLGLDAEASAMFLYENAQRVFALPAR